MPDSLPPRLPEVEALWPLDPEVTFLNHGSFGACPRPLLEEQRRWQDRLERQPVLLLDRQVEELLDEVRLELGRFVGADPDELALVPNATTAVNAVLRSLPLEPGDELLVTDQEYPASRNALDFVAERAGARVVVVPLPFPLHDEAEVVEGLLAAVTDRTRLALIDHVTSATGLVLPVQRIAAALAEHGVETLVDGAHAPGMVPLELGSLGVAYYAGNCHKWLCTPKGSALLYVRRDLQEGIRPVTISHGATRTRPGRSRFRLEFDWTGTVDPSPWLCIPAALRFLEGLLPGGWPALRERNRRLVLFGRALLGEVLGTPAPCPDHLIGSLASVVLPDSDAPTVPPLSLDPLHVELFERFAIEVPVMRWPSPPRRLLRIAAQAYNHPEQYRRLAEALREIGPS